MADEIVKIGPVAAETLKPLLDAVNRAQTRLNDFLTGLAAGHGVDMATHVLDLQQMAFVPRAPPPAPEPAPEPAP